jgi:hypothetical protein
MADNGLTWQAALRGSMFPCPSFPLPVGISVPVEASLWSARYIFHFLASWFACPLSLGHSDSLNDVMPPSGICECFFNSTGVRLDFSEDWTTNRSGILVGSTGASNFILCCDPSKSFPLKNWCIVSAEFGVLPLQGPSFVVQADSHALADLAKEGLAPHTAFMQFRQKFRNFQCMRPLAASLLRVSLPDGARFC